MFRVGCLCAAAASISSPARGGSDPGHRYVIAVGYNGVPKNGDTSLQPLRFADDDAIAFFTFASATARRAHLLTVVDADTERRLGRSTPAARPPTLVALRSAVADVRDAVAEDARTGVPSTVYLYYSGHGSTADGQEPAFALLDGALTRAVLYDEVLDRLPADHVHLFIDACHAEAVVRPRDSEARVVPTNDDDQANYRFASTLARFPNTGAVMAATRNAQAHEWENYLGGVFTHELLSGLRGGADMNGDNHVEYSELAAFLSAANGAVRDPRARLETVTRAPSADPRAPIVELEQRTADAVLELRGSLEGPIFVEDDRGDRLADVHPERGRVFRLVLPADRVWYVHAPGGEAEVRPVPGARISLQSLAFVVSPTRGRGALEAALHEGLFATPFGPSYYQGFIDRDHDLVPVPLPRYAPLEPSRETPAPIASARPWGWASAGTAGALALGAGAFGWMALQAKSDYDSTPLQRAASDANDRYKRDTTAAYALGGAAVAVGLLAGYLFVRPDPLVVGHTALTPRGLRVDF